MPLQAVEHAMEVTTAAGRPTRGRRRRPCTSRVQSSRLPRKLAPVAPQVPQAQPSQAQARGGSSDGPAWSAWRRAGCVR